MIDIVDVSKSYYEFPVLEDITFTAESNSICGLIGYNGAGKTTLLRLIAGIYKPDNGSIIIDGSPVFENTQIKSRLFMLSEDIFFLPDASLNDMRDYYLGYYPAWDDKLYVSLCEGFKLNKKQKINSFSKGMRRQAGIILAFSANPLYLLLDEVFDGLDLSMRILMKSLLDSYIEKTGSTVIVTSHNLRELEDNIDKIVMLNENRLAYVGSVDDIKKSHSTLEEYFLSERDDLTKAFIGVFDEMRVI